VPAARCRPCEEAEGERTAGLRTYALTGLLGGISAAVSAANPLLLAAALMSFTAAFHAVRLGRSLDEAADSGNARKGLAYAQTNCASCHNVLRNAASSPNRKATPFQAIANTPGMSVTALTVWSRTTHPTMPNLVIDATDMDDLIAYILSLRERK
jgi:mono/diheme cytochrome c family protein